ncbi:sensor histidine kinase [Pedobacter frigidisoli]|uniref:sensor histidine kinase n=1 Tax=Pedobacter frigidisoli TaxID=2530455 RepID=UPI00292FCE73|nr:histidine kinase [Pedobacter frigidisoli]
MSDILSKQRLGLDKEQLIHITCWASFIFIEVIVAGAVKQRFSSLTYYLLFYSLNIGIFYLHGAVVMPHSKRAGFGRIALFGSLIITELALYVCGAVIASIILQDILKQKVSPFVFNFDFIVIVLYRALFFIAFGTGYYLLKEYLNRREKEMTRSLEVEKLKSQLLVMQRDYLRAQINPHLLFNTLDFIKAVSKKNPEKSDEAIDYLTEIMDYALETSKKDFVEVARELEQIEYMIRLNSLRSNDRINLKFTSELNFERAMVIPILLLTLVENIFKHGNLLDPENPAIIELITSTDALIFRTSNLIANTLPHQGERTGIKNIMTRLALAYPNNYNFATGMRDQIFYTELRIDYLSVRRKIP